MNKEYAIGILETCERGALEVNCSLAGEAFNYLTNLILKHKIISQTDNEIMDRIYNLKYKSNKL